jgi:hypothetical protein
VGKSMHAWFRVIDNTNGTMAGESRSILFLGLVNKSNLFSETIDATHA